ncbi:MAG: hypothetical protein IVW54_22220 [Candidatus Binataceae bacterium]|nr:hypothetical protein [Candidatus Binataceae bacterium]
MSIEITHTIVARQLFAMNSKSFDIGVLQHSGRMLLREHRTTDQVEAAIKWLRHENARSAHVFVRPHGEHPLSLIDDLTWAAISEMTRAGFEPAVVVETSPRNFQVWLNHGRSLSRNLSTQAAKELARRFGGDPSSADWRHFGRLAGFTNQKVSRRLINGLAPFVKLHAWSGNIYANAQEFLDSVAAHMIAAQSKKRLHIGSTMNSGLIRSLVNFHRDPRYAGDLHRADMAWALYAASRRLPQEEIQMEILRARDLSKKGAQRRQMQYAERTAGKAVAAARPIHP